MQPPALYCCETFISSCLKRKKKNTNDTSTKIIRTIADNRECLEFGRVPVPFLPLSKSTRSNWYVNIGSSSIPYHVNFTDKKQIPGNLAIGYKFCKILFSRNLFKFRAHNLSIKNYTFIMAFKNQFRIIIDLIFFV